MAPQARRSMLRPRGLQPSPAPPPAPPPAPARLEARGRLELGRSWHQEGRFLVERLLLDLLQSLRSTISRKYLQPIPTVWRRVWPWWCGCSRSGRAAEARSGSGAGCCGPPASGAPGHVGSNVCQLSHVSLASGTLGSKLIPAVTRVNWKLSCQTCKMSSDLRGFVVDQFICYDWVLPLSGPATIKVLSIKKFLALGDRYFYPPPCYRSSRTRRQKTLERMQEMRWWWTRMWSRWHPTET